MDSDAHSEGHSVMATDVEWAWAAGLFEGEGSILLRNRERRGASLALQMTDFDIVRRFHDVVGVGYLGKPYRNSLSTKGILRWNCGAVADVRLVLEQFVPHFGVRRAERAKVAFEWMSTIGTRGFKFSDELVSEMRVRFEHGDSQKQISQDFGVSNGYLSKILNGKVRQ
jgi:hypothetical protein